ncbi:diaminopimelate epimerase [Planctomycetota bacterium]
MKFTKMQGLGNDYVYINGFETQLADPAAMARLVSDRHFGIGADGLILIAPSETADARMRIFNADGSEAEMCGNGLRCVAKYVYDHGLAQSRGPFALPGENPSYHESLCIETGNGPLTVGLSVDSTGRVDKVCVNMGMPKLVPAEIPMTLSSPKAIDVPIEIASEIMKMTCLSMGNPHAVIFVDDLSTVKLMAQGSAIENHPLFPNRTNVHFVQIEDKETLLVKTWERGSGITLACGTGACACCVAAVLTQRADRACTARLPGGDLILNWHASDSCVYMTGPAVEVFEGTWLGIHT